MHPKYSTSTTTTNPMAPLDQSSSLPIPPSSASRRQSTAAPNQFDLDQRHFYVSVKFLFRWLVMLWLTGGVVIYLISATRTTRNNPRTIFGLHWKAIYVIAIANHLSLVGAIYFDIGPLLIISTILQCALLVALPALIVEVIPNLLTYGVLLLSIVMLLCYGVLYMRSNAPEYKADEETTNRSQFVPVPGSRKTSANQSSPAGDGIAEAEAAVKHQAGSELSSIEIDANQPLTRTTTQQQSTTPRNSCQF